MLFNIIILVGFVIVCGIWHSRKEIPCIRAWSICEINSSLENTYFITSVCVFQEGHTIN